MAGDTTDDSKAGKDSVALSAKYAARIVATLLVTPDDYLEDYRRDLLGKEIGIPLEQLQQARDVVFEVARVIRSGSQHDWDRIAGGLAGIMGTTSTQRDPVDTFADAPDVTLTSERTAPKSTPPPVTIVSSGPKPDPAELAKSPWVKTTKCALTPATSATPAPRTPARDLQPTSTASLGDQSPLAGAELPFLQQSARAPAPVADEVSEEVRPGDTIGIGQMSPLAALATGKGDSSTTPAGAAELTFEQYASLRATLLAHPTRRAETLDAYKLTDATFEGLAAGWSARIDKDGALKARYETLLAHYSDWVRKNH